MRRTLLQTTDDRLLFFLRLVLGVVIFAHGTQKVFGWFGGYGFEGTMGFFTGQLGIPALFAFLAIGVIAIVLMVRGGGWLSADRWLARAA